jgi:hypothetical protein
VATREKVAASHHDQRDRLIEAVASLAAQHWAQVDPANIVESWQRQLPALAVAVSGAQLAGASTADDYLDRVLAAQDVDPAAEGRVVARSLAGVTSDGRDLTSLLNWPAVVAVSAVQSGAPSSVAMATGAASLDMYVRTEVADAGRVADSVAMTARRTVTGYVRALRAPACDRCVVLAGKWFRWNKGFQRHPNCNCVHVPAAVASDSSPVVDPEDYFKALSRAEQDKAFGVANAQAIRDGANINQVVNAHRGMYTAGGRTFTTEGTTSRGLFGAGREDLAKVKGERYRRARGARLTVDQIYREAGEDRDEALRLMRLHGYLFGQPTPRYARNVDPVALYRQRLRSAASGQAALDAAPRSILRPDELIGSESSSLFQYKGTGYMGVNGALRRENGQLPDSWAFDFARDMTESIDSVMGRSVLPRDVSVQRGIMRGRDVFGDAWDGDLAGAEWTEHAYISTTAEATVSKEFLRGADTATLRIFVPAGTQAIELSKLDYEGELLLQRGLRLHVVTDTGPGPNRVIELEVVK